MRIAHAIAGRLRLKAATAQQAGQAAGPCAALAGVAVTANAATAAQGRWQYDAGSGWTDLPAVALTTPFLLKGADQLRFLPTADWNGTPGALSVRLIDNSAGAVTSGAGASISRDRRVAARSRASSSARPKGFST